MIKSLLPSRFLTPPPFGIIRDEVASPHVESIWNSFIRLVISGSKGPFYTDRAEDHLDYLTDWACKLSPTRLAVEFLDPSLQRYLIIRGFFPQAVSTDTSSTNKYALVHCRKLKLVFLFDDHV